MKKTCRVSAAALVLLGSAVAIPGSARAQSFEQLAGSITESFQDAIDLLPRDVTAVRIGAGPAVLPVYMGDDRYKIRGVPVISFRYRDWFEIDNNELKITGLSKLVNARASVGKGRLRFGPLVSVDFGRNESNSNDLTGLGDVGTSIELGAFLGYSFGPVRASIRARHDVAGGHSGALAKGNLSLAIYRDKKLAIGSNLSTTWASSNYMNAYFGVDAGQSAASGLPVYRPGSSFRDVAIGVSSNYTFNQNFSVISNVRYSRLLGGAKSSPLVQQRGSVNQVSFTTYVIYSF